MLQVGLNSVLGGAMFVTSVVAGSVALVVSSVHGAGTLNLDRNCFLRDVGFFMVSLVSLLLIIIVGKINLWGAVMYISIYLVYGFMVAAGECIKTQDRKKRQSSYALEPLLLSKYFTSFSFPFSHDNGGRESSSSQFIHFQQRYISRDHVVK
jgi:sodium/potassium/calcium exchanger 6